MGCGLYSLVHLHSLTCHSLKRSGSLGIEFNTCTCSVVDFFTLPRVDLHKTAAPGLSHLAALVTVELQLSLGGGQELVTWYGATPLVLLV